VFFETKTVRQPMFDVEAFLSHHSDRRITDLIDEEQFDFLEHYGVKGMRWGVSRNMPGAPGRASTERKVADTTYFKDKDHGRRALFNKIGAVEAAAKAAKAAKEAGKTAKEVKDATGL
jgi:hypothetical protein